jgi:hypothetical protein
MTVNDGPVRNGLRASWGIAVAAGVFVVVGGMLLIWVPGALLTNWLPDATVDERGRLLGAAGQLVLLGLGGVIATVGVGLSLARHGQERAAAERDRSRLDDERQRELRSRFVTTVDLLSAPEPIKRTAALYALGALADDWAVYGRAEEVQVCIDVLCGYLRSPLPAGVAVTPVDEVAVRSTGYQIIRDRLQPERTIDSWSDAKVDLSAVQIDFQVSLQGVLLRRGSLDLSGAAIHGPGILQVRDGRIDRGAVLDLTGCTVSDGGLLGLFDVAVGGDVCMDGARIEKVSVHFERVGFRAGAGIRMNGIFVHAGSLMFANADFEAGSVVFMLGATLAHDGVLRIDGTFSDGCSVNMLGAKNQGGLMSLANWDLESFGNLSAQDVGDGWTVSGDGPIRLPGGLRVRQVVR